MEQRKLVLYCRSSRKDQILLQAERLRKYAADNGCQIVAEVFDKSRASFFRRLKQRKALRLANRYKAEIALVSVSRISREFTGLNWFAQHLEEKQVSIMTPTEGSVDIEAMTIFLSAICKNAFA